MVQLNQDSTPDQDRAPRPRVRRLHQIENPDADENRRPEIKPVVNDPHLAEQEQPSDHDQGDSADQRRIDGIVLTAHVGFLSRSVCPILHQFRSRPSAG